MKAAIVLVLLFSVLSCALGSRIIGYWGCSPGGHASTLSQLQTAVNKGYNTVIFAFYDVDANGNLNKDPGAVDPPKKSDIGSGSFTYLVSLFGGENGAAPTISMSAEQWAKAMYNNFLQLHQSLGFDGIDIDLENAWGGTPTTVECGLRSFFAMMHNSSFIVSMAPQTTAITPEVSSYMAGSWNSYVPLVDSSIIQYVDIVAVQLYNNAVPSNNIASYAQALESGFAVSGCPSCSGITCKVAIPAKKIAFGYPAGPGAAPSGCPGLPGGCPYGGALTSLYKGSSVLTNTSGVMTWSIEWDQANNWEFVAAATQISFH
jgi:chitinase